MASHITAYPVPNHPESLLVEPGDAKVTFLHDGISEMGRIVVVRCMPYNLGTKVNENLANADRIYGRADEDVHEEFLAHAEAGRLGTSRDLRRYSDPYLTTMGNSSESFGIEIRHRHLALLPGVIKLYDYEADPAIFGNSPNTATH